MGQLRDAVRERYALLPYLYTAFEEAEREGTPVMRPMFFEFPAEESLYGEQGQWMAGDALLVRPVVQAGATTAEVKFPSGSRWYGFRDGHRNAVHAGPGAATVVVDAPVHVIPVFQRGGTIVSRQERPRRCSAMMSRDPFTLVAALSADGSASGELYVDDGISYDHERKGSFQRRRFELVPEAGAAGWVLRSTLAAGSADWEGERNTVERIVVAGVTSAPSAVRVRGGDELEFDHDPAQAVLTVRRVGLGALDNWAIEIVA